YFLGQPIPQYEQVLPLSENNKSSWRYSFSKPKDGWNTKNFDASGWKTARGAFSDSKKGANKWMSRDIWLRKTFQLNDLTDVDQLLLNIQHDDGAKVYLNGVFACEAKGANGQPELEKISEKAIAALKEGTNVLAIHCVNTGGVAYIDAGLTKKIKSDINVAKADQVGYQVTATQTFYQFKAGGV